MASKTFVALLGLLLVASIAIQVSADEGASRSLLGKKGHKNNQAAQAIDQSKLFGGGINQAQTASNQDKRRSLLGYFEKSAKKGGKKEKKVVKEKKEKKEKKEVKKDVRKAEEQPKNQQAAQGISQAKPVFVVKKVEEEKPWRRSLLEYFKKEKKEKKNVVVKKAEAQPENQQAAQGIAQAKPVFVVKKVEEEKPWRRSLLGYFTGKKGKEEKKVKKEVKKEKVVKKEVKKPEVKKEKKVKVEKRAEEEPENDVGPALVFGGGINQAQAASNQAGNRRLLERKGGKGKKNNQGAQAADQGGLPGFGGINQAQTAANQGGDAFGAGAANNQAAQAIDQSGLFGGGINQGQAASNQGNRRSLLASEKGGKKGKKNNQAAQAIDQSKLFGGGINQGQAASNQD